MSENKPPMAVWLASDYAACFDYNGDCGASDIKNHHHNQGPYVHLDQFLDEVKKRANEFWRYTVREVRFMDE